MIANVFCWAACAFALTAPVSIAGSGLIMWPLLVAWVAVLWSNPVARPVWGAPEKFFLVFTLIGCVSALQGVDVAHGLRFWSKKDVHFLIVPCLGVWLSSDLIRRRYGRAFWIGSLIAAAWGVTTFFVGVNQTDSHGGTFIAMPAWLAHWPRRVQDGFSLVNGRAIGFRSHPLTYAESLLMGMALTLPILISAEKRRLVLSLATGWLLLAALLFSQSRGPWLAVVVMVLGALVLQPSVKTAGRLGLLLLPALFILLKPAFLSRAASIVDQKYMSNSERLHMWHVGAHVWKSHRLLGVGPGNVKFVVGPYETPDELVGGPWGHLHNTFVNMTVERGVIGLVAFLLWLGAFAGELLRALRNPLLSAARQRWVLTGLLALSGFLVSGFTETIYNDEAVLFAFYAVLGAALAAARRDHA